MAWRLSGWIGIHGTWSPSFPGSATNLTPRGARQALVFRSIMDKKQVPLLCPQRFIPPSWLGSEQAEGPRIGRQGRKARPGPGRPPGKAAAAPEPTTRAWTSGCGLRTAAGQPRGACQVHFLFFVSFLFDKIAGILLLRRGADKRRSGSKTWEEALCRQAESGQGARANQASGLQHSLGDLSGGYPGISPLRKCPSWASPFSDRPLKTLC